MKIQFSLRSLIFFCLLAALPAYWVSVYYLGRAQWPEMKERAEAIDRLTQNIKCKKVMDFGVSAVDYSRYSTDESSEWTKLVRILLNKAPRKKDSDFDDNEHAYSMNISCSRNHFQMKPLQIEYDNAPRK